MKQVLPIALRAASKPRCLSWLPTQDHKGATRILIELVTVRSKTQILSRFSAGCFPAGLSSTDKNYHTLSNRPADNEPFRQQKNSFPGCSQHFHFEPAKTRLCLRTISASFVLLHVKMDQGSNRTWLHHLKGATPAVIRYHSQCTLSSRAVSIQSH